MTETEKQQVRELVTEFQEGIIQQLEETVQAYLKSQTAHLRNRIAQQQADNQELLAELLEYRKIQLQADFETPDSFLYAGDEPEAENGDG